MDEGRPTDPASEPAFAPAEPFGPPEAFAPPEPTEPPLATEPVDPVDVEPIEPRRPGRATIALVIVLILAFISFAVVGGRILIAGPETPPRPEPRLAVTDAAGHLHTMDAKGGSVADYPVAGVEFGFPTWSPDGTRIAVTGDDKDSTAIYVFDAADPSKKPVVVYDSSDVPPFYAYWSPDGRQIAFLAQEPARIALEVAPADGSAKAKVVREGAPLYWDWLGSEHVVAHIGSERRGFVPRRGRARRDVGRAGAAQRRALPLAGGQPRRRLPGVRHDRQRLGRRRDRRGGRPIPTLDRAGIRVHRRLVRSGRRDARVRREDAAGRERPGLPAGPVAGHRPTDGADADPARGRRHRVLLVARRQDDRGAHAEVDRQRGRRDRRRRSRVVGPSRRRARSAPTRRSPTSR